MSKGGVTISRSLKTINEEIKSCNSNFRTAAKSARELSQALKLDPQNTKLSAAYMGQLRSQVEQATRKIALLREQQQRMVQTNGELARTTDQYQKLDIEIEKTEATIKSLTAQIEKAESATKDLGEKGSSNISTLKTAFGGIKSAVTAAIATFTGIITAVTALGVAYGKTSDEIAKASKQFGVSVETFQYMSNRWEQLTGDANAYQSVLSAIAGLNANAELEMTKLGKVLERLGLTFEDLNGMDAMGAYEIYLQALRECETEAERTNLAVKLFGNSIGPWMAEMATTGTDALAQWDAELENAGIMTQQQIELGEKLNDTFGYLKKTIQVAIAESGEKLIGLFEGLVNLAKNLIPLITGIANALAAIGPQGLIVLSVIAAMCAQIPPLVVMLAALNAGAKQYVAAFTSLAILGTVSAIGLSALAAANASNGSSTSGHLVTATSSLGTQATVLSGSNSESVTTTISGDTNTSNQTTVEDNSVNNYYINNELDVDEVIERISNARRSMIGGR